MISSGFDNRLTFGHGRLDSDGYWEFPDYEAARIFEKENGMKEFSCWPDFHPDENWMKLQKHYLDLDERIRNDLENFDARYKSLQLRHGRREILRGSKKNDESC